MHDRGDWLTPTVDGRPDFTKPPLLYWAMGLGFSLFGRRCGRRGCRSRSPRWRWPG